MSDDFRGAELTDQPHQIALYYYIRQKALYLLTPRLA